MQKKSDQSISTTDGIKTTKRRVFQCGISRNLKYYKKVKSLKLNERQLKIICVKMQKNDTSSQSKYWRKF
jgi:hypothetical protein